MTEATVSKNADGRGTKEGHGISGSLADQAKAVGKDLKDKASELGDTVIEAAKEHADTLGAAAGEMASQTTEKVNSALNAQKGLGADYVENIAHIVHRAAGEFETELPAAAHYIHQAADHLDSVADFIRERDTKQMVTDVQEFSRRQPALFFGGALVLGFAAFRFFNASTPSNAGTASDRQNTSNAPV